MVLLDGIFLMSSQLLILPSVRVSSGCSWINMSKFNMKLWTIWPQKPTMEAESQILWTEGWSKSFWKSFTLMKSFMTASNSLKMELIILKMTPTGMTLSATSNLFPWMIQQKFLAFIPTQKFLLLLLKPTLYVRLYWCFYQEMLEEVELQLNLSSKKKSNSWFQNFQNHLTLMQLPRNIQFNTPSQWILCFSRNLWGSTNFWQPFIHSSSMLTRQLMVL